MTYFLFILLLVYVLHRYRLSQLLKYQELRTKISSGLHDDVGTILASVAMQTEMLGLTAPIEHKTRYEKIGVMNREAMNRMRDTVWAMDSRKDNVASLLDRMKDFLAESYAEHPTMSYTLDIDEVNAKSKLAPDVRQSLYLIFKEAVVNAFKYSNGDKLHIKFSNQSGKMSLSVKDNGNIDYTMSKEADARRSKMKMRAEKIGGTLDIVKIKGTEVVVHLNN